MTTNIETDAEVIDNVIDFPNPEEIEEEITENDIYEDGFHKGAKFQLDLEEKCRNERRIKTENLQSMVNSHIDTEGNISLNTPEAMEQFILCQAEQIEALTRKIAAEQAKYKLLILHLKQLEILKKE